MKQMRQTKVVAFVALMAALANVLSVWPLAIPIVAGGSFPTSLHFTQIAIFLGGMLAGPVGGLVVGAMGSLVMSFLLPPKIPFILGGLAILGFAAGFFVKRMRPSFAGLLAWGVQAPYAIVTDYVWFTMFVTPRFGVWATLTTIMIKLTLEAVVCSVLAEILVPFIRRTGVSF